MWTQPPALQPRQTALSERPDRRNAHIESRRASPRRQTARRYREVINGVTTFSAPAASRALPKDAAQNTVHDYLGLWNWDGIRIHHALPQVPRESRARSQPAACIPTVRV